MYCYTIYTENKNRAELESLLAQYFSGFTITVGKGYWQGIAEPRLIITYCGTEEAYYLVGKVAEEIKRINQQESVIITVHGVEVRHI